MVFFEMGAFLNSSAPVDLGICSESVATVEVRLR